MIHANFMPTYLERVLELLADILCHASFPEKELEREREVVLEEIASYKDDPTEQIFDDYEDLLYRGTELGHTILGTSAAVKKYKREQLLTYGVRTGLTGWAFSSRDRLTLRPWSVGQRSSL